MSIWKEKLLKSEYCDDNLRDAIICADGSFESAKYLGDYGNGLLGWYPFNKNTDILLIGSCNGAFIDLLLDNCKSLSVVENNSERMDVIKHRFSSTKEIFFYSDLSDVSDKSFDYVIKIVDIECDSDLKTKEEYSALIKWMKAHVATKGTILLGVPNRLGSQFFSGYKASIEDAAFDGISDNWSNVGRFSLKEWKDIIGELGFKNTKVYYPYPDLLYTQLIYTDECKPDCTIVERLHVYPENQRTGILNERELIRHLADNNVLNTFCNGFLFEISNESTTNIYYATISTDRDKMHSFATMICSNGVVRKKPLFDAGVLHVNEMEEILDEFTRRDIPILPFKVVNNTIEMKRVDMPLLSKYLIGLIDDKKAIYNVLDQLWKYILKSSTHVDASKNIYKERFGDEINWGPILENAYIEMIPANSFWNNGIMFFDQEYVINNCPAKFVLFRAINDLYMFYPEIDATIPKMEMLTRYCIETCWDAFFIIENEFQDWLRRRKIYSNYVQWERMDNELLMANRVKLN